MSATGDIAMSNQRSESLDLPTLATSRLLLRKLSQEDIPALFDTFSHPEVMRFWSSPPMKSLSEAKELLTKIQEGYQTYTCFQMGIERREDSLLIGTCTLFKIHESNRRAEIGYALGRPYWGSGYMHEALSVLIGFAFSTLNFNRLEADIDPRNTASAKTLTRLGFEKEGLLRERWIVGGEVSDSAIYGLLKRDWLV